MYNCPKCKGINTEFREGVFQKGDCVGDKFRRIWCDDCHEAHWLNLTNPSRNKVFEETGKERAKRIESKIDIIINMLNEINKGINND